MSKRAELRAIATISAICFAVLVISFPRQTEAKITGQSEYHPYIQQYTEPVPENRIPIEQIVVAETSYYEPTEEEIELMARVVMSEASILPIEGKQAVAQTIINRMYSPNFPNNIEAVINQPYQFSTADNGTPNSECYEAVEAACRYIGFPTNMVFFRADRYHSYGEPYVSIGNTYFSTEGD